MILSGKKIIQEYNKGYISIAPFNESQIQSVSYKLKLSNKLKVYKKETLDATLRNDTKEITIPKDGLVLEPGTIYLGESEEKIGSLKYLVMLKGRSTTGRLGLFITICSDIIEHDKAAPCQFTLVVTKKLKIYPNIIIGQVTFWEIKS